MAKFTFEEFSRVIAAEFNVPASQIIYVTTASDIDGWDSISHATLIMKLESAFNVTIDMDAAFSAESAGELYALAIGG